MTDSTANDALLGDPPNGPNELESQGLNADDADTLSGNKNPTTWVSHPIDIRISLPFLHRRFYFTVVAGQERRHKDRVQADRQTYPLITAGNVMFSLGVATLFTLAALAVLVAHSAIIE
jgi:hypothetical protein